MVDKVKFSRSRYFNSTQQAKQEQTPNFTNVTPKKGNFLCSFEIPKQVSRVVLIKAVIW